MSLSLRRGDAADAAAAGDICYRAFKDIAEAHNFPPDFPGPEMAAGMLAGMIAHPGVFDLVAEVDGRLVGSNFLDERNPVAGIGPITVDPTVQNDGAGRALMLGVMQRVRERGYPGVRLVQSGYHSRSLALYLRLGFEARELLVCLQGPTLGVGFPGYAVRAATPDDRAACNQLCFRVHGLERGGELSDAIAGGGARVVERDGRITGYATAIAFFGHAVAETNDDLKALIGAAEAFLGPGLLAPTRNGELVRWCLSQGLRITQTMTLMSVGLYNEPSGAWLPSVMY
ncbi:GNAT family N-acetyltransferase [Phenylobacterium sp.]|uniref:GNAT family N-acetyltransferase n=1 Tax=Phenylobacterium sp. TaxID=1871053 RepID=UPI00120B44CA|nr:GNAT family N-acetyltransferase [Phenylobacterium sp.]THD59300.1 MAG: GNAT family N-acetyltransferase [Phenylobacterium sp.]